MRLALFTPIFLLALLTPAAALPAEATNVLAAGFSFLPPIVSVRLGEPVTWEGLQGTHTVTTSPSFMEATRGQGDDPENADLDPDTFHKALPQGVTLSHTFESPGSYPYYCVIHYRSGMVGQVDVE
jgi:plastocyanin